MIAGRSVSRARRQQSPHSLKPLLWLVGAVIIVLGAISVVAVLHALRLEHRVNGLPATVNAAVVAAEDGHLAVAEADLANAQHTLTSINKALYNSPDFSIVHILPVARQNVDAMRRSVNLGLELVAGGQQILDAGASLENLRGHLDVSLDGGRIPLATTSAVGAAITQVLGSLPPSAKAPSGSFLVGPVRSLEQRVYSEAYHRRQQLQSVGAGIQLLDDMAGGSGKRRYLIAVGNSAEMRGSGGMILSYGVISGANGMITLDHFGPIAELRLSGPETKASFPADFEKSEGYLAPTQLWENANMMSDFTVDAPVLEAMYTQSTRLPVDGVIQIDPAGLGAILAGIGPVQTADLGVISPSNVAQVTLSQAYFLYTNRAQRQDYTGEAAEATFAKLTTGRFSTLRPLGSAILQAGLAHHILMYTSDSTDESLLVALGFDGALPPPHAPLIQLTVQNFGGNKLDYYLHSSVTLTGQRPSPKGSQLTATIRLSNGAPSGQASPTEVFGPSYPGESAGEYVGLVTLYLPADSYLVGTQHADASVTSGPSEGGQNGVFTVSYLVAIPAGGSSQVTLHLRLAGLPRGTAQLDPVPAPRVYPTSYTQKYT